MRLIAIEDLRVVIASSPATYFNQIHTHLALLNPNTVC